MGQFMDKKEFMDETRKYNPTSIEVNHIYGTVKHDHLNDELVDIYSSLKGAVLYEEGISNYKPYASILERISKLIERKA